MSNDKMETAILTKEQENCVNYGEGDLLIRGVAGSGKSYVILRRAILLNQKKKNTEKIAIFTYANTLVKYTDELISASVGEDVIEVSTVDSYCSRIYFKIFKKWPRLGNDEQYRNLISSALQEYKRKTGTNHRLYDGHMSFFEDEFKWIREKCIRTKDTYLSADRRGRGAQVRLSNSDKEFVWGVYALYSLNAIHCRYMDWPDVYLTLLENIRYIPDEMKIDHVLLDEAQDLTVGKLMMIKAISRKSLTIAADIAQKIYKTSFTWKEVGIDISGRASKSLSKSFRSTRQIVELAEDLMEVARNRANATDGYTEVKMPEIEGPKPRIVKFNSLSEEDAYFVKLLSSYIDSEDVIGIICRTSAQTKKVGQLLDRHGLKYEIIDKQKKEKAKWSLLRPGIKLVVAHSSKGLEFDRVIIPYFDDSEYPFRPFKVDDEQMDEYIQTERSIIYVAMTRAKSTLTLLCVDASSSRFIEEFKPEHYEMVTI